MAEPETPTPPPSAPAPEPPAAPPADDSSGRLAAATERLERIAAKAGVPAPEEPAPEPAAAAPPAPPVSTRPPVVEANERYQARIAARREKMEREALARVLERVEQIIPPTGAAPAATAAPAAADPEPDFNEDPRAWYLWKDRQRDAEMAKSLEERFGPLAAYVKRAEETEAQARERMQREAVARQEMTVRQRMAVEGEDDYLATPEGAGYYERFLEQWGHQGDAQRGVPPIDGRFARGLMAGGVSPQRARTMNWLLVQGIAEMAFAENVNPAVVMDAIARQLGAGGSGIDSAQPSAPPAPAAHPAARAGTREIARLKAGAAAASGGAAGSLSDAGAGKPATASLEGAVKTGSMDAIKEAIKARYGVNISPQAGAALRRVAHEMRGKGA